MPVNHHLRFADLTDFVPGLWTESDWNMPATGAQTMSDVMAELGGGLRAAPKVTAFSTTGLPTGAGISVLGTFCHGGQGNGAQTSHYLVLKNGTNWQVWGCAAGLTTWTQIGANQAIGAGLGPNNVVFDTFTDLAGVVYVVFNIWQTAATDGVYSINTTTLALVRQLAVSPTCLCVQDDRIIAANGGTLRWTDSQSVSSWPAANTLKVQISRQNANIIAMRASAPSDLLLGMQLAPWVSVQGDITDPVVQSMSDAVLPGSIQSLPQTAQGLVFIADSKGLFLTGDGSSFQDLSKQIVRSNWRNAGIYVAYNPNFIVTGNGHTYDERTNSWFRFSAFSGSQLGSTPISDEVFAARYVSNAPALYTIDTSEQSRASTWTWKSAPFRSDDGRQIEIREVQAYVRSNDSGATVAITVNGTTRTVSLDASTGQMISTLFVERGEKLDVQVVATAGNAANEAPSLEILRVGQGAGHQTY